jgi:NADPH:quinone reductase-like Zn-dependent oxidoreductase
LQLAATHIPPSLSFAQASVLPLAIATAAVGLFPEDKLNLPFPSSKPSTQHTVVVWGGSSSVGTLAIQLAHASGAHVITTASKRNHAYVTELGADEVFDHSSPSIVDDLVKAVKARGVQGFVGVYDAISHEDTIRASAAVVSQTKGKGIVITTLPPPEVLPEGVEAKVIFAGTVLLSDKVLGHKLFREWLGPALANGKLTPKPDAQVIGKGLESLQKGVDLSRQGVSAKKLVVSLE